MTVAPHIEPLAFETLEDAVAELRRQGMRLSTARRLVLEALYAAEGPVSALRLSEQLGIDPTSVYRNLEALERRGIVRHIHLGHGPGLYVLCSREEREYLYCESCAKVTPVAPGALDPVRRRLRDRFGYEVKFTHFAIVGLCTACAASRAPQEQAARAAHAGAAHRHAHPGAGSPGDGASDQMHSHGDYVHAHETSPPRRRGRG
ncbi:MAG TPA: Fur family transcriptional regulator [Solirubrobacteraceae bacterium]|nr:Fur family transcriptional regulator [Solirubrobacteraceae bacterium]